MVKLGFAKETVRGFIPPGALRGPELQRIVSQALDRVMAPADRDGAIQTALANGGQPALPERASELTAFVFGPLRDVVEQAFGAETAERLLYSLTPFLKQACRHEHEAAPGDGPAEPSSQDPAPPATAQDGAPPPSEDPPTQRVPEATEPAPTTRTLTSGATLLIVDGEPRARAQLSHRLREAGFDVFTAPDGHVALAVCMRNRPDAIIAALEMPTVGSRQLMALLRVAFASDAPPVIVRSEPDVGPAALDDAAAVIPRSASFDELRHTVEAIVVGPSQAPSTSPADR